MGRVGDPMHALHGERLHSFYKTLSFCDLDASAVLLALLLSMFVLSLSLSSSFLLSLFLQALKKIWSFLS